MSFRDRLTLSLIAITAIPLLILGLGVRREMTARLDAEGMRRVRAVESSVAARVSERLTTEHARLESLASELAADSRFWVSASGRGERRWLLDWAPSMMRSAGFAVLVVQDSAGRILSSGQFRNDYDRVAPGLPRVVASTPALAAVVDARTPNGAVRALVMLASFTARGERYTIIGGSALDSGRVAALSSDRAVSALLATGAAALPDQAVTISELPFVSELSPAAGGTARIGLVADAAPARALKAGVVRWLLLTLGLTLLVAVAVAAVLGRLISSPIADLAGRTARLDLDKLDQRFGSGRMDELGVLERTLDALTGRLRASANRIKDAERAAATGDIARQVNHDIRNGLTPIRNVVRHLSQVADREPARLASLYAERRATLEAGVEYLNELARNYARLSPVLRRGPTDPRPVVLAVARCVSGPALHVVMPESLPAIRADAIVLHRILDNLVANAIDALEGRPGSITIAAEVLGNGADRRVRFSVADTGRGMTSDELDRAFNDFHTTKPTGTGLGLTVVRRLVTDVGGAVRAESALGRGSTFSVDIPAATSVAVLPPMVYAQ